MYIWEWNICFFFSSRRRHTRFDCDWSSDVCSSDLGAMPRLAWAASEITTEKADYTLRIGTGLVELAPGHILSTTLYNDQFPGPLLRFKEGQRVVVDIHNDTDTPELVHWHGQMIPSDMDGSAEEGSPFVPPHGMRQVAFVPKPSGFRFYHTHVV